jgi:hypothetical protein
VSGDLTVSLNTNGLSPGSYSGVVTISDISGVNGPQQVSVSLDLSIPAPPSGTSLLTNFTLGSLRNDFTGFVGMKFTVGSSAITLSHLGRLNVAGNSQPHMLKLVNALTGADVPGGSISIVPGTVAGTFAYGALAAPVALAANTPYYLGSQETSGQDQWYDLNTSVQTTADAIVSNSAFTYGGQWYTSGSAGRTYGPVNLAYTLGGTVTTPANPNPPTNPTPPSSPPSTGGTSFVTGQNLGTLRNNFTGFVGMQILVGNTPITITGLGRYVAPGNSGNHVMKIVNAATGLDVTGSAATVATTGVASGTYAFAGVSSVVLSPNTSYYIVTQEAVGGDTWYDLNTVLTTTGVVPLISAVYGSGSGPYIPISSPGSYGPVNFQYQLATSSGSSNNATYVKFDTSTFGTWTANYGSEGKAVVGDTIAYPGYANVIVSGAQSYAWAGTTSDMRGLQKPSNLSSRIAATWYAGSSFSIDVPITDGQTHQIALYTVDWDNNGPRKERIDVMDADSQAVLDSQTISDFRNGGYAVWNIQGHVVFRITNLSSSNAVVSGIFFGGR